MAFALPSFNAAVASANTSGLPMQRLMSQIDFKDVKSTAATTFMAKDALQSKVLQANIAKQALAEYGGTLRNQMTLDYNREVLDAEKEVRENARKDARRAKLFEMLGGSLEDLVANPLGTQEQYQDPRQMMQNAMIYEQDVDQRLKNQMGGLHPDKGLSEAMLKLRQMAPKRGDGDKIKEAVEVINVLPNQPPTVGLAQPSSQADLNAQLQSFLSLYQKK